MVVIRTRRYPSKRLRVLVTLQNSATAEKVKDESQKETPVFFMVFGDARTSEDSEEESLDGSSPYRMSPVRVRAGYRGRQSFSAGSSCGMEARRVPRRHGHRTIQIYPPKRTDSCAYI